MPLHISPKNHRKRHTGQSLVEYALTIALITLVCIVPLTTFGQQLVQFFQSFASQISAAANA